MIPKGQSINGQSRETGAIGYTRNKTKTNNTKTIQRNWRHWVHKTQNDDKQHKNNPEKLAPLGTQETKR